MDNILRGTLCFKGEKGEKGQDGAIQYTAGTNIEITEDNVINVQLSEILNIICPIGKVEVFFDNEDHSNYLGFTWERTSIGKVPVGIDSEDTDFNTIGNTGGEKTHTLTTNEMPAHNHPFYENIYNYSQVQVFDYNAAQTNMKYIGSVASTGNSQVGTNPTGGGAAHNNLQPYEVMAFWKRIA